MDPIQRNTLEVGFFSEAQKGGFPKLGYPFGGPYNKDYSILGSILGSPYFGKLPKGCSVEAWGKV